MPCRPRWIADDDLDPRILLAFHTLAVTGKPVSRKAAPVGVQVERIRKCNAWKRFVAASLLSPAVKRLFDVNGGDVVGEEDDLVGV